ncbi:MAG TPA: cytochrome c peroxidase [Planctomycetota bacterium]|nr:cytochrome c peroxidase [Planctomycetota bacterium]
MSHDGRILVHARVGNEPPSLLSGWHVHSFRPEAVTTTNGIAYFPPSYASPPSGPWSVEQSIETNITPPPNGQHDDDKVQFSKQTLSMCPDPNHRAKSCPFPSNSSGVAGQPGTAGGSYDTYLMMVVAPDEWPDVDPSVPNDIDRPRFLAGSGIRVNPIGMRFLRVTVQNPRTPMATPSSWSLSTDFKVLTWTSAVYGDVPVLGIEPSLSLDGRLLVFQGNESNNYRVWNTEATEGEQIMYTFNLQPGVSTGWSRPYPINEMFSREQNTLVNGIPFARLYPIAAAEMTMADGTSLSQPVHGAYPWMTLDATDFVFSAIWGPTFGLRHGMSIVGRSTGYYMRHIDGPLNPDRYNTPRIITTGTGAAPGIWAWGGDTPGLKLPYTRLGTSIPLLTMHIREYAEICVNEAVDRDYLLAWDMNEFVNEVPIGTPGAVGWVLDTTRTPDTSGHGIAGNFADQMARFPEEWGLTGNTAVSGQYIVCADAGAVNAIDPVGVLNASLPAMTAECWFSCTSGGPQPFSLIRKAGAYELEADRQGLVRAKVTTAQWTLQSPWLGAPMGNDEWRHVAMTYDSVTGQFRVYIDGGNVHEQIVAMGHPVLASPSSTLIVGPAGIQGQGGMVGIDQVRLSRVERTADEIARAAFATPASSGWQQLPTTFALPLGLDRAETKVPVGNLPSRDAIDLGEVLFHDARLSGDGNKSCALCHVSTQLLSFTDSIDQRLGFGGTGTLLRNAPTVLNRVFSTEQFWDGHAEDLEKQVLFPLFHPEEMGADPNGLLTYLNASDNYVGMFASAYSGALPSIPLLQNALASYERALVVGNSNADRYEDGQVGALSASEERGRHLFFGKARCFGCHSGSNYSDERYHVSVEPSGADAGRKDFTRRTRDLRRFKTPTLRNLMRTAPYFHRGQQAANPLALANVIDKYNAGGTTLFDEEIFPLGLTSGEKFDLEAFLLTLTGVWQKL